MTTLVRPTDDPVLASVDTQKRPYRHLKTGRFLTPVDRDVDRDEGLRADMRKTL